MQSAPPLSRFMQGRGPSFLCALGALALSACGSGQVELPEPRPVVVFSGARINADEDRLKEIHAWVTDAAQTIEEDPSFWVEWGFVPEPRYPWETLEISGDTVHVAFERSAPDAQTSYQLYGFLHLMQRMGRLGEWFPEAEGLEGWELERFIVARTADSWLLGRAVFDTHPYRPLDELIYADDAGMLDAFLLHARGDEFPEARDEFLEENDDGFEPFLEWYQRTFGDDPPGGG